MIISDVDYDDICRSLCLFDVHVFLLIIQGLVFQREN